MHPILEWNAFVQLHYRYQDRYVAVSGLLALAAELFGDRHRTVVRNQRLVDMGASILWLLPTFALDHLCWTLRLKYCVDDCARVFPDRFRASNYAFAGRERPSGHHQPMLRVQLGKPD